MPSTKASLLCTVSSRLGLIDEAIYPIRQKLCDYIIHTYVKMHGEDVSDESRSSFRLFIKMANDNRGSSAVQFGLSVCPDFVSTHSEYPLSFDYTMRRLYDDSGIGAFGVLGFVPDHVDLPTSLRSWLRVRIETLSVA
ncbi:hypothetical protein IscW_ISCW005764 [Ixodes scapularis]|uniref:Uncharacterized protein n=1 Tax=Ixodes scapularis TaxID=6945 RepID=B7PNK8_IXOSC|nr:hypothetical protein IscW_ISCW005764 [Ixodes scapularis]|eukprot:XP_002435356.1 hypothetical protein IscW_ISCW005764 [Ixodes scapularis]